MVEDIVEYTIIVTNNSDVDLTGITITDLLPNYISGTFTPPAHESVVIPGTGVLYTWNNVSIVGNGGTFEITFSGEIVCE